METTTPNTTAEPYASLFAYKARSLNGIWATAPYLHNGSVPTLYDLLLPKKKTGDPDDGDIVPINSKSDRAAFDPEKVGLKSSGYSGFTFDTRRRGNSNAGAYVLHWAGQRKTSGFAGVSQDFVTIGTRRAHHRTGKPRPGREGARMSALATPTLTNYLQQFDAAADADKWPLVRRWIDTDPLPFFKELREKRPI